MDEEELKNKIFEIALTWRDAVEKLVKIEGKMPSNYLEDSMLALIASYSREVRIRALTDVDNLNLLNDSGAWHEFYINEIKKLKDGK